MIIPEATLMTITTRQSASGMFFATSEDEPTFFVSTTSAESLVEAVRCALEDLYKGRHKSVAAVPLDKGDAGRKPWAIVPKTILEERASC